MSDNTNTDILMAICGQKFGLSMNAFHLPFSDGSMQQVVEVQPADGHLTKQKLCFLCALKPVCLIMMIMIKLLTATVSALKI